MQSQYLCKVKMSVIHISHFFNLSKIPFLSRVVIRERPAASLSHCAIVWRHFSILIWNTMGMSVVLKYDKRFVRFTGFVD